jgi:hypothetical protein
MSSLIIKKFLQITLPSTQPIPAISRKPSNKNSAITVPVSSAGQNLPEARFYPSKHSRQTRP